MTFGIWLSDDAEVWAFEWLIGAEKGYTLTFKIRGAKSRRVMTNQTFGKGLSDNAEV